MTTIGERLDVQCVFGYLGKLGRLRGRVRARAVGILPGTKDRQYKRCFALLSAFERAF
jgi:hypothetical protein